MTMTDRWVVWAVRGALAAGAFVAVIGLLHLPVGRSALRWVTGGCPIGMDIQLDPAARDAARTVALRSVQGDALAAARPALGFALERTTREDVAAWAQAHQLACAGDGPRMRCADVPAALWGGPADADVVLLQFDARDALISATATVSALTPAAAAAALRQLTADVVAQVGPPTSTHGGADAASLAAGGLSQSSSEFRFADYRAQLVATQVSGGRVSLRSVFQAIPRT